MRMPQTFSSVGYIQKQPRPTLSVSLAQKWLGEVDRIAGDRHGVAVAVRLMLGMGLREAEAITARWEWLDWDRGIYTPGITKGREADPVPVPVWLAEYFAMMRKPPGLIVAKPSGLGFAHGFTRRAMLRANDALFEEFRAQRDAWLNWPARVGPLIAAELGVEAADKVTAVLTAHVHKQISNLGEPEANFSES